MKERGRNGKRTGNGGREGVRRTRDRNREEIDRVIRTRMRGKEKGKGVGIGWMRNNYKVGEREARKTNGRRKRGTTETNLDRDVERKIK